MNFKITRVGHNGSYLPAMCTVHYALVFTYYVAFYFSKEIQLSNDVITFLEQWTAVVYSKLKLNRLMNVGGKDLRFDRMTHQELLNLQLCTYYKLRIGYEKNNTFVAFIHRK